MCVNTDPSSSKNPKCFVSLNGKREWRHKNGMACIRIGLDSDETLYGLHNWNRLQSMLDCRFGSPHRHNERWRHHTRALHSFPQVADDKYLPHHNGGAIDCHLQFTCFTNFTLGSRRAVSACGGREERVYKVRQTDYKELFARRRIDYSSRSNMLSRF